MADKEVGNYADVVMPDQALVTQGDDHLRCVLDQGGRCFGRIV